MLCSAPLYYICQALSTYAAVRAALMLGVGTYREVIYVSDMLYVYLCRVAGVSAGSGCLGVCSMNVIFRLSCGGFLGRGWVYGRSRGCLWCEGL